MAKKDDSMKRAIVQAVTIAALIAIGGGAWKTYLTAHDTALKLDQQQGKIEWLYNYMFPKDGHESPNR
jgi:hypothetical protein